MHVPVSAWAFMSRLQDGQERKAFIIIQHSDVSVNDGPHIRRWSHMIIIIILYYNTIVLQLPTVFSTVKLCTWREVA
jgi:hypothetical protein